MTEESGLNSSWFRNPRSSQYYQVASSEVQRPILFFKFFLMLEMNDFFSISVLVLSSKAKDPACIRRQLSYPPKASLSLVRHSDNLFSCFCPYVPHFHIPVTILQVSSEMGPSPKVGCLGHIATVYVQVIFSTMGSISHHVLYLTLCLLLS